MKVDDAGNWFEESVFFHHIWFIKDFLNDEQWEYAFKLLQSFYVMIKNQYSNVIVEKPRTTHLNFSNTTFELAELVIIQKEDFDEIPVYDQGPVDSRCYMEWFLSSLRCYPCHVFTIEKYIRDKKGTLFQADEVRCWISRPKRLQNIFIEDVYWNDYNDNRIWKEIESKPEVIFKEPDITQYEEKLSNILSEEIIKQNLTTE